MRNKLQGIIATVLMALAMSMPALAEGQSLIYVINVDVMPPFTQDAGKLLKAYQECSAKEKGAKRIEVLQRLEHGNHYALIEEWDNQADYDAHRMAKETRKFRTDLQPMLGSPFDERVHHNY
jgi:quinol monooxygenase YgiN